MNKFLIKLGGFFLKLLALVCLLIAGTILLNYNHPSDYPAAIKGKYERLDSLRSTTKVIIAGGSSSSYSIDSKLLQDALKMPAVNTSLAMGLGSLFHLNLTKEYIHKGDVVLYIPEYEFYYGKEVGGDFLHTTAFYYPQMMKDFEVDQQFAAVKNMIRLPIDFFSGFVMRLFKRNKGTSLQYTRTSYNYIGDNTSLISEEASKVKREDINRYQKLPSNKVSTRFLNFLIDFNQFCLKRGAKLVISFPPIEASQFDHRFLEAVAKVQKETEIPFLDSPMKSIFTADLFYDSSYHLNGKGRKLRTGQLIETLNEEWK